MIATRRPDADIRSLSEKEAHKLLEAANRGKLSVTIVFFTVTICLSAFFLPQILHGLETGQQTIDIKECQADCATTTHNIILSGGYLYTEEYIFDEDTDEKYIAFVPENWRETDPVYAIVKLPKMTQTDMMRLSNQTKIPAVMRTIMWEGIPGEVIEKYRAVTKVKIADSARLFQYEADTSLEFVLALVFFGTGVLALSIVTIVIRRIQKNMSAPGTLV